MATIVQHNFASADGTSRSGTVALRASSTPGNTIVLAAACDKDAGSVPDGPLTPLAGRNSSSITLMAEAGAATGTREDALVSWTTGRPYVLGMWEIDVPFATASIVVATPAWTTEVAVDSASIGPWSPLASGLGLVIGGIDTITNWSSGGRVARYTGSSFVEHSFGTTAASDTGLFLGIADAFASVDLSTLAAGISGGRDQVSLVGLAIGTPAAAVSPPPFPRRPERGLILRPHRRY